MPGERRKIQTIPSKTSLSFGRNRGTGKGSTLVPFKKNEREEGKLHRNVNDRRKN